MCPRRVKDCQHLQRHSQGGQGHMGLSPEIVRTIYVAVIEPIVMYASCAWAPAANICADRELESPVDFCELPHPAHIPELGFESVEDLDPTTIDRLAIVRPHIYTDGSKIEGKVGAALTEWRDGVESGNSAYRLESFCTVFQAEIEAGHTGYRCGGWGVRLFWVRAHAGTAGNERADELARNAALKKKTTADYDRFPLSFAKKAIRAASLDKWQKRYAEGITSDITKCFFPRVKEAYGVLSRVSMTPLLAQTLTGHGGFAQYLHRFKLASSPYCAYAPDKTQDLLHVLEECPIFLKERAETEVGIGVQILRENFPDLLKDDEKRKIFFTFCEGVVRRGSSACERYSTLSNAVSLLWLAGVTVQLHSALILSRLFLLDIRMREVAWLYNVQRGKVLGDTFVDHNRLSGKGRATHLHCLKPDRRQSRCGPDGMAGRKGDQVLDAPARSLLHGLPGGDNYAAKIDTESEKGKGRIVESRAVRLFWVRAHAGIAGNERADEFDRWAGLTKKTAADYDRFPLSHAKKNDVLTCSVWVWYALLFVFIMMSLMTLTALQAAASRETGRVCVALFGLMWYITVSLKSRPQLNRAAFQIHSSLTGN
ncbi:Putative 115 kDa protein in type-1 retrotransposable element R1DM [Eumeta japonica]|uniref:115 kDa protein in type-1 retrotransposable element R1DM n=1 Tax=Eumeta variegata TaxID=151549 RepID=A0A4C1XSS1_EUMVA|nr:Putative 115 kDa protein in type-1 retrotransposable element R1DM [Eumeta japonica]